MANGTRGGSNDASLPLVASDDITSGTFNGQSAQVMKLGTGPDSTLDLIDSAHPLPVSSARGLGGGIIQKVTTLTNANTAYPIPATPLTGRASIIVQAVDTNTDPVWIGSSTVTAGAATTGGIKLMPGQSLSLDLQAGVVLYANSTTTGQKVASLEAAF